MIITFTGPSGSGKTTILRKLQDSKEFGIYPELISHTTRQPRDKEVNGKDYYFVSREQFSNIEFTESVEYAGNLYGLSIEEVKTKLATNKFVYVIVDINGVSMLQDIFGVEEVISFFIKTSDDILYKRLIKRDGIDKANARMGNLKITNENIPNEMLIDFVVSNNSGKELNIAIKIIKDILRLYK